MTYSVSAKRLLALITLLSIITSLVSCTNPVSVQTTTITIATNTFIKSFYPSLASLADKFHKQNPTITVQVVSPPEDDWTKSDLSMLASAADVTLLSPTTSIVKP